MKGKEMKRNTESGALPHTPKFIVYAPNPVYIKEHRGYLRSLYRYMGSRSALRLRFRRAVSSERAKYNTIREVEVQYVPERQKIKITMRDEKRAFLKEYKKTKQRLDFDEDMCYHNIVKIRKKYPHLCGAKVLKKQKRFFMFRDRKTCGKEGTRNAKIFT
jgi:hypothetical protein